MSILFYKYKIKIQSLISRMNNYNKLKEIRYPFFIDDSFQNFSQWIYLCSANVCFFSFLKLNFYHKSYLIYNMLNRLSDKMTNV